MKPTRRSVIAAGGGLIAALSLPRVGLAAGTVEVRMLGRPDGSVVWFDPVGIHVDPGQEIRWTNLDPGNSHTATAYHPQIFQRPRRIPAGAEPWNSDYLLPQETFAVRLTVPGVYDFYCVPHEHAGMVGRIVVGDPGPLDQPEGDLPEIALAAFPAVAEIMRNGVVRLD